MIARKQDRRRKAGPIVAATLCTLALVAVPAPAQEDREETVYGDDYGPGNFGRVRDAELGVTLVRADWERAEGLEYDGVNSPVFPGDRLATDDDQRVEIELAGGSLVHIDRRTQLTFLALPDPYAEFADNTVLQLAEGRIRVAASLGSDEEFRIDTPSATVYPLDDADLRIEVIGDGRTRVLSRRGVAEVVGNGGSVLVRGGMRTEVEIGSLPNQPEPYNTFASDGFDLYVEQREASYDEQYADDGTGAYQEIPGEVQPYYQELSSYGSWVETADYGWVWVPGGVASDWRPYYDGYWGYGSQGYFWVSNEPWGWAPYHYGRWAWTVGYGWGWVPGRVFAGAWVSWSWGSAYVGWGPLDCWGYPAYRYSHYYGYYDPYAWTFVSYAHVHHHHYGHHSVSVDHVGDSLRHNAVVTRPPKVSPRNLAGSRQARERAVRSAHDDTGSRIAPSSREVRRSAPTFRKTEDRLASRGDRGPSGRDGGGSIGQRPERAGNRPTVTDSRFPRQISARPTERVRKPTVSRRPAGDRSVEGSRSRDGASRTEGATSTRGQTRLPRVKQRENDSRRGVDRVRDMYRKMARPRQTRDPGENSAAAPGVGQGSTRKPTPKARPRPGTGTRKPTPRARPKPSSGSRKPTPKARPKPSSGSRKPTPRARPTARGSSGSSGPRPGAASRPSGGTRSTPRASKRSSSGSRRGSKR